MKIKREYRGSVSVFVLILVGMSIGLYLMGFTSAFINELSTEFSEEKDPSDSVPDFLDAIGGAIFSAFTENLSVTSAMLGFGLLAGFTGGAYAGGSILRYLIPIMLLFVVVNIFLFPVIPTIQGGVTHTEGFDPIIAILTVILNTMMFLSIFEFISGEE
jgi:hypothetical protein